MPAFRSIVGCAAVFLACVLCAREPEGYPLVSSYPSEKIGLNHKCWSVVQDENGLLLFGTSGLVSFDGQRWDLTPMNGSYALRGLDIAPDGRIWAGAAGEIGWFERQPDGLRYRSLVPALPAAHREVGQVLHAFAEKTDAIFVTDSKVLRWSGEKFQVWPLPGTLRLFACRSGGTIFVHHKTTGVLAMREDGLELVIPAGELGDAGVFWIERAGEDWLLVTRDGLMRWSPGRLRELDPVANATIREASIRCVVDLGDGRLALGTGHEGVLIVGRDGKLLERLGEAEGLPTRTIYSLFVDRDRQLWGTSASHVFRVSLGSPSRVFDRRAGLPAGSIPRLAVDQGRVFAIVNETLHLQPAGARDFAPPAGFKDYALDLFSTPRGVFLATSRDVKRFENGAATRIYSNGRNVFTLEASRRAQDYLLLSETSEVKLLAPDGTVRTLARDLPDIATSIAEDDDGRLWLGTTSRGILTVAPNGHVTRDAVATSSGPVPIAGAATALATAEGDVLIFSTSGGWIKPHGTETFAPIAGFPQRETIATSPTRDRGNLWLVFAKTESRPAMIGQVAVQGDRAFWRPHAVDGIESIGSPRSILAEPLARNGTVLWIGGTQGILRNAVAHGPSAPRPQAPMLQAFASSGEASAPVLAAGTLPYSTEAVEFRIAAPQLSTRPTLRLESRIEGIDRDWVPAGPSARRELTALRDGRYTIRARTVADTGAASESTVFAFEVSPPWWRTWPAAAALVLALAPLAVGSYRLRVRALRRRNATLEEKVRQRTVELEAASAAKTQFVANMSHDIRNPLNGIVGLALALEDTRLEPRQREIVATLRECTTYLSTLVDDVLDFASIEAGRVVLRPRAFAPAELLRSVVATLRADTAARGASVAIEIDPGLPAHFTGDAGRIQQVLVNFVSNALKYAGGEVRLSASLPGSAPGEIEFCVRDRGPGIGPEDTAKLFGKFSRLARPEGDATTGTGLGLAACRLLADLMGGSVGLESTPGQGSRFFLRLPLAVANAPAAAPAVELPNSTVLLVEDTDYNAWAAAAVLNKLGLGCERAKTGAEALRLFGEKRFNIVLLDRCLPDMDGTEVARQMREMEAEGQQALLLAVTAYCTAADRQLCLDAGMDAFIGKPLTPEKLRKLLGAAGRRLLAAAPVQVTHEASPAAVDTELFDFLSGGSTEGLDEHIHRFLGALREAEQGVNEASGAGDFSRLRDAAHSLLGQARTVRGNALAEAALSLEAAARSGDRRACSEWLRHIHDEIEAITESMTRRRSAAHSA